MGYRPLIEFRSELDFALGGRGFPDPRLNRWINDGYFDLTGAYDLEELHETSLASIVAGVDSIRLPDDMQWLRSVHDNTEKKGIVELDEDNFWMLAENTDGGPPEYWTRVGDSIRLWPAAGDAYSIRINYNRFPALLSASSDVSAIPPTWDRAISMFAVRHALLDLGEEFRSDEWYNQVVGYISSRILSNEMRRGPKLGVRTPKTIDELRQIRG